MRTKVEKTRQIAAAALHEDVVAAVQLMPKSAVPLMLPVFMVVYFGVGAGLPSAVGMAAIVLAAAVVAARSEYSRLLVMTDAGMRLAVRRVTSTSYTVTPVPLSDVRLLERQGLGYLKVRVQTRTYNVRPVYDRELARMNVTLA